MSRPSVVAGCLGALVLTSCTSMKAHVMARAVADGLYSIERYRARTSERGLLRRQPGVPVVKSILYERPWKVRAEVVAPAEHAGETFVFDGKTVSIWWPHSGIGLRITGIEDHDRREVAQVLLEDSYWILGNYEPVHGGSGRIAGRDVEHWRCEPNGDNPLVEPYHAWMDAELALPLGVSLTQTRNTGPAVVPDVGIRVHVGAEQGVLNFAFGFTIVSWSRDNTALTLIGNLPYPEMLAIAASVVPHSGR
jgi:outer membrane lipoprotein-sorting protein